MAQRLVALPSPSSSRHFFKRQSPVRLPHTAQWSIASSFESGEALKRSVSLPLFFLLLSPSFSLRLLRAAALSTALWRTALALCPARLLRRTFGLRRLLVIARARRLSLLSFLSFLRTHRSPLWQSLSPLRLTGHPQPYRCAQPQAAVSAPDLIPSCPFFSHPSPPSRSPVLLSSPASLWPPRRLSWKAKVLNHLVAGLFLAASVAALLQIVWPVRRLLCPLPLRRCLRSRASARHRMPSAALPSPLAPLKSPPPAPSVSRGRAAA